jgi:heme-degrading monooxygenase HmoA
MSYARVTRFRLQPGQDDRMEQLTDQVDGLMRAQPGFQTITYVRDQATGEYLALSLWESREQAEAATAGREALQQHLQEVLAEPPTTTIYEVYDPHR